MTLGKLLDCALGFAKTPQLFLMFLETQKLRRNFPMPRNCVAGLPGPQNWFAGFHDSYTWLYKRGGGPTMIEYSVEDKLIA